MSNWGELEKEMQFDQGSDEKPYIELKAGLRPEVATYTGCERVECNTREANTTFDDGRKLCDAEGKITQYLFLSPLTGAVRNLRSNSKGHFLMFKMNDIEEGDTIRMERTGSGKDTRYTATKLTPEEVTAWVAERKAELESANESIGDMTIAAPTTVNPESQDPNDIPF